MSLDTYIRFLEPVDPRTVWAAMREVIEAPSNYTWDRYPAQQDMSKLFAPNPTWFAPGGQGAQTLAAMSYGAEGSLLDDREWDEPDLRNEAPPPAYVVVSFTNGDRNRHDEFAHALIHRVGVPAAVRAWYASPWAEMGSTPSLDNVRCALNGPVVPR